MVRKRRKGESGMNYFAAAIDVRQFASKVKHHAIFSIWNALSPGSAMLIINDHDPKPLYYQLDAECGQEFQWNYLERGPECWQVEIRKVRPAAVSLVQEVEVE